MKYVFKAQSKLTMFVQKVKQAKMTLINACPYLNLAIDAQFVDEENCVHNWRFHDDFAIEFLPDEKYDRAYHNDWQQFMLNCVLTGEDQDGYYQKIKPELKHQANYKSTNGQTI